jgi:hypothetical protein
MLAEAEPLVPTVDELGERVAPAGESGDGRVESAVEAPARGDSVAPAVAPAVAAPAGRSADAVALLPGADALAVLLAPPGWTLPTTSTRCPTYLAKSWPLSRYIAALALARAPGCAPPAEIDPPTLGEEFPDVPVAPVAPADAVDSMNSPLVPRSIQPVSVSGAAPVRVDVDAGSCVRAPGAPTPCEPLCTGDCVGVCVVA